MKHTASPDRARAAVAALRGDAFQKSGRLRKAAAEYRRALALDGSYADAWYGLGRVLFNQGEQSEAISCFRRTLELDPGRALARFNLGIALFNLGHIDSALDQLRIVTRCPDKHLHLRALGVMALIIPGSPRAGNAEILRVRRQWAKLALAAECPRKPSRPRPRSANGKLRIGYCSKFFFARNWMKPIWGFINHHSRQDFDIHLFNDGIPPGVDSGYHPNPADRFHDTRKLSNAQVARLIRREGIDVLVDLNGYGVMDRLGVYMRRPAPVIVGLFNLYATSGIDAIDYTVGDAAVIPPSEERYYSERVLRVPGSYLAFSVLYAVPKVSAPPCLANGHITFGSLCTQYKLTDEVIATWSAILRRAPRTRLLLRNVGLNSASNQSVMRERFARHGIERDRLVLEGQASHGEFLKTYARMDIALDAFPYNGGTTTMEALWQGVPVLTFNGDRWASRQSRSLLLAAGLSQWCVPDVNAYIDRAVALAKSRTTPAMLAKLRAGMREKLSRSRACDSEGLCKALEEIYRKVAVRD